MPSKPLGTEHAMVIGGSIAGLLAARALADHYQRVTILDRDSLPTSRGNRRGVPQGWHTHGLLAGGRQALENLFPGITCDLTAAGAVPADILGDNRWFFEGACHVRFPSGLKGLLMSRPFLEGAVRERVRKLPRVCFREQTTVSGLIFSPDNRCVVGVRTGAGILPADLVVDATGRGSHSPQWLAEMGYPRPSEERVEIALSYTTRVFRRHPEDLGGDAAVIIPPTPTGKCGGVMLAQEGNRWTVTLLSHFGPPAPGELEGFIRFTRKLPAPYIYEVVRRAEPLDEPSITRFPASVRRRYEKLERFPQGYLVIGDAISSFNPIYGQGMTVAALEATELRSVLAKGTRDLARRFFSRTTRVVGTPWSTAVGNDLRMPETVGPRSLAGRAINRYLTMLHRAAHRDRVVALAFHRVGNLLAPPPTLLHPRIAWRVLWQNVVPYSRRLAQPQTLRASAGR